MFDGPTTSAESSGRLCTTARAIAMPDGQLSSITGVAACERAVPALRQFAVQPRAAQLDTAVRLRSMSSQACTRRTWCPASAHDVPAVMTSTDTSGWRNRWATSRSRVTRPATSTRSGRLRSSHCDARRISGPCGVTRPRWYLPNGSAITGQPATSASSATSAAIEGSGRSPSTTSVFGTGAMPGPLVTTWRWLSIWHTFSQASLRGRPARSSGQSESSSSGTSGGRNGRLRCTGPASPAGTPVDSATARPTMERHHSCCPARFSGTPNS